MNNLSNQMLISQICQNDYHHLLNLKNVNGIGYGYKYINGKNTGQTCIRVLVKEKIPKCYIHQSQIVPSFYKSVLTDVIDVGGEFTATSFKNRVRPLQGGYGISTSYQGEDYSGTLGCIVRKKGILTSDYFILSNNHVIAASNQAPKGNPILQPSILYGGSVSKDVVANLSESVHIKYISAIHSPDNFVDCAIGKIKSKSLLSKIIAIIGYINGVTTIGIHDKVKKVGQNTALTEGIVTTTSLTMKARYGKNLALFKNQMEGSLKSEGGDSGSIVLNERDQAVGLVFSASKNTTVFNDINKVLSSFNVKIYSK